MSSSARIEDAYPLSPLQEGLLFHCVESEAGRSLYVSHVACRLVGLDREAFTRAFQALIDHHPVLRTAFVEGLGIIPPAFIQAPGLGSEEAQQAS
jgi:hypothetical protein